MTKYGAKKVTIDGITFDSKVEGEYYLHLKELKSQGIVSEFETQPKFELQPKFTKKGKKYLPINYIADFKVTYSDGRVEIVDIKGMVLSEFRLKEKMFNYNYPELDLVLLAYSKIDGGWITLDDLAKARKARKKLKKTKSDT